MSALIIGQLTQGDRYDTTGWTARDSVAQREFSARFHRDGRGFSPSVIWKNARTKGFLKTLDQYFFTGAIGLDTFANYEFRTLWNTVLRKRKGYNFGAKDETISSALGKNQRLKTLSFIGWMLVFMLWAVDYKYWKKGGHCINSIV